MCDPLSLATAGTIGKVATGLQIAGAVSGAYGAYQTSTADKAAYNYQAQVQRNNAQIANWQAKSAIEQGQVEEANQRLKTAQIKGAQRARMAANGVDIRQGSALNTLLDTEYMGDVDAATIHDNAANEAWALRNQATNYSANAGLLQARASMESPLGSGASTLLTGAGAVASSWYKRRTATVPGDSAGNKQLTFYAPNDI